MKLNYDIKPEQTEVQPQPEEQVEAVTQSPYTTTKKMDSYRDYVDIQNTLNALISKSSQNNPGAMKDSNVNTLQTGGAWNKNE